VPSIATVPAGTAGAALVYLDSIFNRVFTNTGVKSFVDDFTNGKLLYITTAGTKVDTVTPFPALIQVSRTTLVTFVQSVESFGTAPGNDTLVVDGSKEPNYIVGTLGGTSLPTGLLAGHQISGTPLLSFVPGAGSIGGTILRSSGDWSADGFKVGDLIFVQGSIRNNGVYTIAAINSATSLAVSNKSIDPANPLNLPITISLLTETNTANVRVLTVFKATTHDDASSPDAKVYFGGEPVIDPFTKQPLVYTHGSDDNSAVIQRQHDHTFRRRQLDG